MEVLDKIGVQPTKIAEQFLKDVPDDTDRKERQKKGWFKLRFLCTPEQSAKITGNAIGGDDHISWNRRYADSVSWARKKFYDMLDQGWLAFTVNEDGSPGERITEFDSDLEDVIVTDKDIVMTPPTVPG